MLQDEILILFFSVDILHIKPYFILLLQLIQSVPRGWGVFDILYQQMIDYTPICRE